MNFNQQKPQKGSLLLSEPFILDPTFERSVILLSDHNSLEGSSGFILNKKSETNLNDVLGGANTEKFPVFIGGPVALNSLLFIHRAHDVFQSGEPITEDIYWGGDLDHLLTLIEADLIQSNQVKFFAGYSGWQVGQLEEELNQNNWAVKNSLDADLCFLYDGEDLWKRALIEMGPRYAHVANFPRDPYLN